ncbi:hypothetical protein [Patulibacter minatonensis]|uniref:hypothetical protein n=1 Tax=Patulibacter minatonensis TaxID=298163 RepID=UPI00047B3EEF|nr:hypothetical protein [Patulibacter minatonensis]
MLERFLRSILPPAVVTVATACSVWWLADGFAGIDGIPRFQPRESTVAGCVVLEDGVRAAIDRATAGPLLLLTGCLVASAVVAGWATHRAHGARAGRGVTVVLVLSALVGGGLCRVVEVDGGAFLVCVVFFVAVPFAWLVAMTALCDLRRTRWPGGRRSDVAVAILPLAHLVLAPIVVAVVTETGEAAFCM